MLVTIQSLQELEGFFAEEPALLAVDTETTGLRPQLGDEACGYSFSYRSKRTQAVESCYVPIRHKPLRKEGSLFRLGKAEPQNLPVGEVNEIVRKVLGSKKIRKIMHNSKFDLQVFWKEGIHVVTRNGEESLLEDTMILSHLIDPRRPNGLKKLMELLLGEVHEEQQELLRYMAYHKIKKNQGYHLLPIDVAGPYAARDTDATLQVFERLVPNMAGIETVYDLEMNALRVIAKMEWRGMPANKQYLADMAVRLRKASRNVEERAWKLVGRKFDLDSTQDIAEVLFGQLRIPFPKGAKGLTDKTALEKIEHPVARLITCYRQLTRLAGTYMGPMAEMVSEKGRIHPSFQQVKQERETLGGADDGESGTDTGRLSCVDPNLQNVTSRRKVYKKGEAKTVNQTLVRRAFRVESPAWEFLLFDFSQIELRVLAQVSQDPTLLDAYTSLPNKDIHLLTAKAVFPHFDKANEKEKDLLRSQAKQINFGIVYGMGAERLALELGLIDKFGLKRGVEMARDFLEKYFTTYPMVREADQEAKWELKNKGYVSTLYGRRRYLRPEEEYKALNTKVQGTAADMNKIALHQVECALVPFKSKLVNNIHDEVSILRSLEEDRDRIANTVMDAMEDFPGFTVPIVADATIATPAWSSKKKYKLERRKAA